MTVRAIKVVQGRNKGDNHAEVKGNITMAVFADTNEQFKKACADAGVEPTKRQASKWRSKRGLAYKTMRGEC